jgi:hypothetical protein
MHIIWDTTVTAATDAITIIMGAVVTIRVITAHSPEAGQAKCIVI